MANGQASRRALIEKTWNGRANAKASDPRLSEEGSFSSTDRMVVNMA